ncbi:unnamed protein product, partial [Ectocarpus sp. 12 AP-2014]
MGREEEERHESAAGRVIGEDGAQNTAEGSKKRETGGSDGEGVLRARHPTAHRTRHQRVAVGPACDRRRCCLSPRGQHPTHTAPTSFTREGRG